MSGEFVAVLGGRFLRPTYEGSIQANSRQGEELFAFNSVTQSFESSWIDDFHMSGAIMFSQGPAILDGFDLLGEYDVAPSQPKWGWRTVYLLRGDTQLSIASYNIDSPGQQSKAVETSYSRQ